MMFAVFATQSADQEVILFASIDHPISEEQNSSTSKASS